MVVQKHPVWNNFGESRIAASAGSRFVSGAADRTPFVRHSDLLVWDWFRIDGDDIINPYVAKWMLAWQKLTNRGDSGTAIILATPYDDLARPPVETLREFALDMMPSINAALGRVEADNVAIRR